jgi:hypothetical protein
MWLLRYKCSIYYVFWNALKQMNSDVFTALFKADTRVRKMDVPWGKEGE